MTPDHLSELQTLFQIGEHNPITLRALRAGEVNLPPMNLTFSAANYHSIEARWSAFAEQAEILNHTGYNIYTCLNPIKPNFEGSAVSDIDIECRRLLLIDLDRNGTYHVPAEDDEVRMADKVADEIETWFADHSGATPIRTMSGNGVHLYYTMEDLPNDRASRDYVRNMLKSLAQKFDTEAIKVDTAVHNASRITKVPGTLARKGKATADRPHRRAVFL